MEVGRPFIIPNEGYFVWVIPPFIDGNENRGRKRVLCSVESEKNGVLRMCAVALDDKRRAHELQWQEGVALNALKSTFGTATKKPEVYVEKTADPETGQIVPIRHFLHEDEAQRADK